MLLIAEIILTFFAWRNGWKWLALIPIGIAFLIGLIVGYSVGMSGGSVGDLRGILIFDIFAIIALIVMCVKKREIKE